MSDDLYSISLDPDSRGGSVPNSPRPFGAIGGSDVGANEQDDQRVRDLMEQHLQEPSILTFLENNLTIVTTPGGGGGTPAAGATCYDYVVDSSGNGTHLTVRAMIADFLIAAAAGSGVVKACWLCNSDTDTNIEYGGTSGNISTATLFIDGPGSPSAWVGNAFSPRMALSAAISDNADGYFKSGQPFIPRLVFRNLQIRARFISDTKTHGFIVQTTTAGQANRPTPFFYNCDFAIGYTTSMNGVLVDCVIGGAGNGAIIYMDGCTGFLGGILRFAGGFYAGSIEINNCRLAIWTVCSNISTSTLSGVTIRGGSITTLGYLLNNVSGNGIGWHIGGGAEFRHTGATVWMRYTSGQIGAGTHIYIDDILYSQSSTTLSAVTASSPAFGSNHTIWVSSAWFYADNANAATAVVVTGANWLKADRGPISAPHFAAPSSGLTAV